MLRYVLARLLHAIPVFLGVTVLVFAMVRALPGDPADALAELKRRADAAQ